jgi:hypothetical protein
MIMVTALEIHQYYVDILVSRLISVSGSVFPEIVELSLLFHAFFFIDECKIIHSF